MNEQDVYEDNAKSTRKRSFVEKYILNIYVLVVVGYLVIITFVSEDNLFKRYELINKIEELSEEKTYLINKINENRRKTEELNRSKESLEKFAREQYLMKRPNEDIYIIVND